MKTARRLFALYWLGSFVLGLTVFGLLKVTLPENLNNVYGSPYKMPAYHLSHPIQYWLVQSFVFSLLATAWWQMFYARRTFVRSISAVLVIPVSVLFAAPLGTLLWVYHDWTYGSQVGDILKIAIRMFPLGIEAAIIIFLYSIPFNVITAFLGILILPAVPMLADRMNLDGLSDEGRVGVSRYFTASKCQTKPINLLKTYAQTAVFWVLFLYVIPQVLLAFEPLFGLKPYRFDGQMLISVLGFSIAGLGGLWSGTTMALKGDGTPLPLDTASRLVVSGPYRFVRNPMAVFGLAQGLFVGIYLGSYLIFPYVIAGAFAWDSIVRPLEEQDLRNRFGSSYDEYCRNVDCWRFSFGRSTKTMKRFG